MTRMLQSRMEGGGPAEPVILPVDLVVRESA
jgi:DNA-binding LacI/PurR family transcriptional regulator